jgi:hypothetical protein
MKNHWLESRKTELQYKWNAAQTKWADDILKEMDEQIMREIRAALDADAELDRALKLYGKRV